MPDLDEFMLASLAREMAMNIRPVQAIFDDFKIDENDYYQIEKIEFYQRAKAQFALEWNSSLSATERVKLISAAYLEQILPVLGGKALNTDTKLPDATEIGKFFAKNAGIGVEKNDAKASMERFQITINLGADVDGKPVIETYDKPLLLETDPVKPAGSGQGCMVVEEKTNGKIDRQAANKAAIQRLRASRQGRGESGEGERKLSDT